MARDILGDYPGWDEPKQIDFRRKIFIDVCKVYVLCTILNLIILLIYLNL